MISDFTFEPLGPEHEPSIQSFDCRLDSLARWLRVEAPGAQRGDLSRTYVSVEAERPYPGVIAPRVIGYFTLCPTFVTEIPSSRGGGFPSYLLCKLARDQVWSMRGHGGDLLAEAMAKTVQAADAAGGRFLVVDPKVDDPNSEPERLREFYRKHGFKDIDGNDRMYVTIKTLRKLV